MQVRRKRFVSNYDNVNVTKYNDDYRNYEEELFDAEEDEFDSTVDSATVIKEVFTELYMDIDK